MDEHREDERTGEIASDQEADLDAIMAGMDAEYGVLPEQALLHARQHREAIIPRLIDSIRAAAAEIKAGGSVDCNTHFMALFLLWEFRAKEALDAVVEAVSLPGQGAYELFSDAVTECLPRILAVMAEDRLEVLDAMIRDPALDEFVRREAADAFCYLARDGKLSREEVVPRLRQHLFQAIERNDAEMVGPLVLILADFAAAEALDEIRLAFEKNLVEEDFASLDTVLQEIAAGQPSIDQKEPAEIEDAIEELRFWMEDGIESFQDFPRVRSAYTGRPLPMYMEDEEDELDLTPVTIRYDGPHVGRNDPCPCGSGRKFKKCCGSPTRSSAIDL